MGARGAVTKHLPRPSSRLRPSSGPATSRLPEFPGRPLRESGSLDLGLVAGIHREGIEEQHLPDVAGGVVRRAEFQELAPELLVRRIAVFVEKLDAEDRELTARSGDTHEAGATHL